MNPNQPKPRLFQGLSNEPEVVEVEGDWSLLRGRPEPSSGWGQKDAPPSPIRLLEAALFVAPKPLVPEALTRLFPGFAPENLEALVEQLNTDSRNRGRPFRAVREGNGWILRLLADALPKKKEAVPVDPGEVDLAQDAIDVLALIAYRQPIELAEIDAVRGSESVGITRKLMRLGLIKLDTTPSGKMFATTDRFLQAIGMSSLKDLPRVEEAG